MCDQGPALLVNNLPVTRLTAQRIDEICDLIRAGAPLAEWPADYFKVEDNIRRADMLLGGTYRRGDATRAALVLGAQGLLNELKRSNLRGRGGAGFTTAVKWETCREAPGERRFVICNADEGEPGTFKDRVLLQSFAERVFEGMTLAALATGAQQGFVYLRGEYSYLRTPLEATLSAMRRENLLGERIGGVEDFHFDIAIHFGAGAYICGEETALIESLEGKPGRPRIRPPFPATHGYLDFPTVVNNVETLCKVTEIALIGGAAYAGQGTEQSTGTKILSVSGDCERPGLYEYPFGVRVARVLEDCGAQDAGAVQIGGAAGNCLTPEEFGRRISFEDQPTAGAVMVFGGQRDPIEAARNFAHFFAHESCGFCTPCRVGTALVAGMIDKIAAGHGALYESMDLKRLHNILRASSHCGLGQTAMLALHDMMHKFKPAFERRLITKDFEPDFDLDAALARARELAGRDDAAAHLGEDISSEIANVFTLDGQRIVFEPGQSILTAALAAGVYIPHLCAHPDFPPHGSCKLCTVTVNGRNGSSCTIKAMPGQDVRSNTPELNEIRRVLLQMLFVEGNHFCPGCEKSGQCKLQALAYDVEMLSQHFVQFFPHREVDASHPEFFLDFNRCIMCELCVRASRDVDGKNVFASPGAGAIRISSRIRPPENSATPISPRPTRRRMSARWGRYCARKSASSRRSAGGSTTARRSAKSISNSNTPRRRSEMDLSVAPRKVKIATATLGGCFGCHMSLLDIDERLLALLELAEFDRSPLTDIKHCGPSDIGLIEGALCNAENVHVLREFRRNCKFLVAVGACAINGGLPAQRNRFDVGDILKKVYSDTPDGRSRVPNDPELPLLLDKVYPIPTTWCGSIISFPAAHPPATPCGNS